MTTTLAERIAALGEHELAPLLHDQLRILQRVAEDPTDLFSKDDPIRPFHEELTEWERGHLTEHLRAWLDEIEANRTDDTVAKVFDIRAFGATGDGRHDDRPPSNKPSKPQRRSAMPASCRFPPDATG